MNRHSSLTPARQRILQLVALAGISAISTHASGQVIDWINPVNGVWSNPANWGGNIPNAAGESARLGVAGAYAVTVDGSFSIDGLEVLGLGSQLLVNNSSTLRVSQITNNRLIVVNPTAGGNSTVLAMRGAGSTIVSGTGVLRLNASANLDTAILQWTANPAIETLTNEPGHTIAGAGNVYVGLVNNGVVSADAGGRVLNMLSQGKTNNARMEAINGGVLRVQNVAITQGASGLIDVVGGTLDPLNISVSGGEVRTDADPISLVGTTSFSNVKMTGAFDIPNNCVLQYTGALFDLTGDLVINPTGGGNSTWLRITGPIVMPATARTILNANPGNPDTAFLQWTNNPATEIFTFAPGHIVKGTGTIPARFTNDGLVSADVSGRTLRLYNQPKLNNARMEAVNGGVLRIENVAVTQSASGIIDVVGGTLDPLNISVSGGELRTDADPISLLGTTTFSNVKMTGAFEIPNNSVLQYTGSVFDLTGDLVINPTGGGNATWLRITGPIVMPATTRTILNANPANPDTAFLQWTVNPLTEIFTFAPGHIVKGTGTLPAKFTNDGRVSADVSGRILRLNNQPKTNNARIEAVNGGVLQIQTISITQGANGLIDVVGGTLDTSSITVSGGEIRTDADPISLVGTTSFSNVKMTGAFEIPNNSVLQYTGSLFDLTGDLVINPTGGGNFTWLRITGPITMPATARTILNANSGNPDTAFLQWTVSPVTEVFTFAPGHIVKGTGTLPARFTNNGLVSADVNGAIVRLNNQPKTNNARIEAVNGGVLQLQAIQITQGPAGVIDATGGTLTTSGTVITGGSVVSSVSTPWVSTGGLTLSAVTKTGPLHIPNSSSVTLAGGTFVNHGELHINPAAGGNTTTVSLSGAISVSGTGTILLNASSNLDTAAIYWTANPAIETLTLGALQTVRGNGNLAARLINNGILSPGVTPGSAGRLHFASQPCTLNATSRFECDINGTAPTQFDRLTGSASVGLNGTLAVTFGFIPNISDQFDVVGSPYTGRFSRLELPKGYYVEYLPSIVRVIFSGCMGDWDQDGDVDSDDVNLFFADFENGESDIDNDGDTDSDDIIEFFGRFESGC